MNKLICFLIGHKFDYCAFYYHWPVCERCDMEFDKDGYEITNFEDKGILYPFIIIIRKLKCPKLELLPRCLECGKLLGFRRYKKKYCSRYCEENSLPF